MKLVSFRELRNVPGKVRELIEANDVVLTARGKPVAVIVPIADDDVEETLQAVRRARLQVLLSRVRRAAAEAGTRELTREEIDDEIRASRERR